MSQEKNCIFRLVTFTFLVGLGNITKINNVLYGWPQKYRIQNSERMYWVINRRDDVKKTEKGRMRGQRVMIRSRQMEYLKKMVVYQLYDIGVAVQETDELRNLPDESVSMEKLREYGYIAKDMYPQRKEKALYLHRIGEKIYCLQRGWYK
jgi:hypothetical protein